MTCREALEYTARLQVSSVPARERVDNMLSDMGLESCQDTRVGNEFIKGLSGGQRRRLSLAIALLGRPLVLFLDEITSGLDAASAAGIMNFLSDLTKSQNIAAISTIHQPSSKVFKSIDKLVLLSAGRVAYCGPTLEAVSWFESMGRVMPAQENPADFVLEQINKDFVDPKSVDELLEAWDKRDLRMSFTKSGVIDQRALRKSSKLCFSHEVFVLLQRQAVVSFRDPTVYSGRMLVCCLTNLFFTFIYIESRNTTQNQALSRQWLIAWHLGIATLMSMVYCFAAGDEFTAVTKEVRANNYRLASYIVAQTLVQIPLMVLLALSSTMISGFGVNGWSWKGFLGMETILVVTLLMYESLAQLLAVSAPHPALATMGVTTFWLVNFLFGGALVRRDDVPWPLRIFSYVAPYGYASRSMIHSEYMHHTFEGAVRNGDGSYSCPNTLQTGCYGITGPEVLNSLSNIVYNISAENTFWSDLGLLLGIALFFKLLFIIMAYYRCFRVKAIGSPVEGPPRAAPVEAQAEDEVAEVEEVEAKPTGPTDEFSNAGVVAEVEV